MKESQIREYLSKGWIRSLVTFEVVGKPKEHVEQALTEYLDNIKSDQRIVFLKEDREKAIDHDDGMFSTFCEAELLVQNLETFTWLCINFSPASIEIIEPDDVIIKSREITNWLNDLLAKVHEIGTSYRSHKAANDHLVVAMNQMIKNIILLLLKSGTKTEQDLEKGTGILAEQLAPFLKHMAQKGEIEDIGGAYALPNTVEKKPVAKKKGKKGK